MGNEKAINQLIAHHSIVFEPEKRLVWVSTAPWQLGAFVCYDLNKVFSLAGMKSDREISDSSLYVGADSLLFSRRFLDFTRFRAFRQLVQDGVTVPPDSIIANNPSYYHSYVLAGDMLKANKDFAGALRYYEAALTKEIATLKEKTEIEKNIRYCKENL